MRVPSSAPRDRPAPSGERTPGNVDLSRRCSSMWKEAPRRCSTPPHLVCDLDDQRQLRLLLVGGERVALDRRREPALRREAELVEGDVAARLVDPPLELVLRLERAALGRDETEDDLLRARQIGRAHV